MFEWLKRLWNTAPDDPETGIPNFGVVIPGAIYRGGAPSDEELERAVAACGIRTVLDLRFQDARRVLPASIASRVVLRRAALDDLGEVDVLRVEECARILALAANQPVLVHCAGGRDRTGAVVACFRATFQHWAPAEIVAEARRHGLYGDSRHRAWAEYVEGLGV